MLSEPMIKVVCDQCHEEYDIEADYVYTDYSGKNGFYKFDDNSILKKAVDDLGFTVIDGNHLCEWCSEEANSK